MQTSNEQIIQMSQTVRELAQALAQANSGHERGIE